MDVKQALGFAIVERGAVRVIEWPDQGCRPATESECALWDRTAALTAEVEALRRDAERYRFLKLTRAFRNPEASDDSVGYYGFRSTPLLVGMTLDAAIDAAIGQTVALVPVPVKEGLC